MNGSQIVDVLILIYYVPIIIIAVFNIFKYSLTKFPEWRFIGLLSLFRLIGAGTGIPAAHSTDRTLITVSIVFSSIGNTMLLACLLTFARRINSALQERGLDKLIVRVGFVVVLVSLILSIVGGSYSTGNNAGTSHATSQAASILLLVALVIGTAILFNGLMRKHHLSKGLHRLNILTTLSIPFLFVKVIYTIVAVFNPNDPNFQFLSDKALAVILRAVFGTLMEWAVIGVYTVSLLYYQKRAGEDEEPPHRLADGQKYQQPQDGYQVSGQTYQPVQAGYEPYHHRN